MCDTLTAVYCQSKSKKAFLIKIAGEYACLRGFLIHKLADPTIHSSRKNRQGQLSGKV